MAGKLLDTTILVDLSRGYQNAADFVDNERRLGTELFVSVVSAMELIVGCRNRVETKKAEKLITDFMVVQLTAAASQKAYELILTYSKNSWAADTGRFDRRNGPDGITRTDE